MKKLGYLLLVVIVMATCGTSKNAFVKKYNLPANIAYSDGYRMFVDELAMESQGLESLAEYQPSNMMREKYSFVEMPNGEVGVEGFIQVVPSFFDAVTFEKEIGGYLTYLSEGVYRYTLPVRNITRVLAVRGIVQMDVIRKQY